MAPGLPPKPTIHRNDVGRRVSRQEYIAPDSSDRYYFEDKRVFAQLFKIYNNNINNKNTTSKKCQEEGMFFCIGYANTKFHFCTRCREVNKSNLMEKYFIKIDGKKTIYCHGCMGYICRQQELLKA